MRFCPPLPRRALRWIAPLLAASFSLAAATAGGALVGLEFEDFDRGFARHALEVFGRPQAHPVRHLVADGDDADLH